jgi:hypothetical protein
MFVFRLCPPALLISALLVSPALAQTLNSADNFTSFVAVPGKPVQLGYYASAKKDCTPLPLPVIRVIEPPRMGTLTVRRGVLNTSQIAGCANLKTPANVVFYVARAGASGTDHLIYQVTNFGGESGTFDVRIEVKEPPNPPAKDEKI